MIYITVPRLLFFGFLAILGTITCRPFAVMADDFSSPAPADVSVLPSHTGNAPPAGAVSSTCNCAATGVCICPPGLCRCPACKNGQLKATSQAPQPTRVTVQSYATATNHVDRRGRIIIEHSPDRHGRRLARHAARGIKLGVHP